jgi:hypothetical protein
MRNMNTGAWPVDPDTQVGLFRTELGDTNGVPNAPADGLAVFEFLSDVAIAALLLAYPTSRDTAMAKALTSAAFKLIASAQDIQVDDIKIKTVERANLMLTMASGLSLAAAAGAASSAFNVVPLTPQYRTGSYYYGESGF